MSEPNKRLHTLLTDRAIAGLDDAQQAELRHLLVGAAIDPSYEAAAAAIELSLMAHAEAMPPAVKAAVIEQASVYWGFMVPRRHDQTIGSRASERDAELGPVLDGDDLLLGDAEPEGEVWDDDDDHAGSPEPPESPESIDEAVESGVLESSLTNGRIARIKQAKADAKPGAQQARRRPSEPKPQSEPGPVSGSHDDLDPRAVSQSDLSGMSPAASRSDIVRMPVSESRLARGAIYASAIMAMVMLSIALWLYAHRDDLPDPDDLRAQVEAASDKLEWTFAAKPDPAVREGASGSVLWSTEAQAGVLILDGLEPTGSGDTQYQLWIVDNEREGAPVDGGVFDVIEASGEVQIPIDAKLVIGDPAAFLITVERPGGVVVSAQARVVMVATGS
jgi:anti-sigma-K factor RskA